MASRAQIGFRRPEYKNLLQRPLFQKAQNSPKLVSEGQNWLQRPKFASEGPKKLASEGPNWLQNTRIGNEVAFRAPNSFKKAHQQRARKGTGWLSNSSKVLKCSLFLNLLALRRHKAQKSSLFDLLKPPRLRNRKATDDNSTKSCAGAQGRSP